MDETRLVGVLYATRNESWPIFLATALVSGSDTDHIHGDHPMGTQLHFWNGALSHLYRRQFSAFETKTSTYIKEESDFGFLFPYALTVDGRNVNSPFSTSMTTV